MTLILGFVNNKMSLAYKTYNANKMSTRRGEEDRRAEASTSRRGWARPAQPYAEGVLTHPMRLEIPCAARGREQVAGSAEVFGSETNSSVLSNCGAMNRLRFLLQVPRRKTNCAYLALTCLNFESAFSNSLTPNPEPRLSGLVFALFLNLEF
jgi:hypothetical protein